MRFAVWRNTLAVIAAYVVAIYAVDRVLLRETIASRPLALAFAFTIIQVTVVMVMLLALFAWKRRNVLRNERSARLGPAIDEALALHTVGEDRTEELRMLAKQSRYDVRERLLAAAATTRGEARERVLALIEYLLGQPCGVPEEVFRQNQAEEARGWDAEKRRDEALELPRPKRLLPVRL